MESVLLLNTSFEPLRIISWQRAVCLFFLGKVEIIEEYDHDIHSVPLVIKAPAVVRLLEFVSIGRKSPPLNRANILARDLFECQYCGCNLNSKEATLDHVIPRSHGGKTCWENIVCSCSICNRKKGGRTPREARMTLKRTPSKPGWLPVLSIKFRGNVPLSWHAFLH